MKIDEAFQYIEVLYHSIRPSHPDLAYEKVDTHETLFKYWFREEVPARGYSKKSGVYIFSTIEKEILYIGKAASDNFGAEIYSKFGAATSLDENNPCFGNSLMAEYAPDCYKELIRGGNVCITAISIHPKEFTSLFEVYLQTCCAIYEELPPLNRQIG